MIVLAFLLMLYLLVTPHPTRRKLSVLLQLWFVLFPNRFQEQEHDSDLMSSYMGIKTQLCILDKVHPIPD